MPAPKGTNFQRGKALRQAVALQLRAMGLHDAQVRPMRRTTEASSYPEPDVHGLPATWHVDVAADRHERFSVRLDAAVSAAEKAGREHAAVILARQDYGGRERQVSESFVLMTLADFATILRREAELESAAP
jgi:hypothetical protein